MQILYVGIGGFLGAVSRFLVSRFASNLLGSFPLGTLVVNVVGSLCLGFIMYSALLGKSVSTELRSFAAIGFIGAFTTMSTFTYETVRLYELKDYGIFGVNLMANIFLSVGGVLIGRQLAYFISR